MGKDKMTRWATALAFLCLATALIICIIFLALGPNEANAMTEACQTMVHLLTHMRSRLAGAVFVGHVVADTDTYCSAFAAAEFFDGIFTVPQGALNTEIMFVVNKFNLPSQPPQFELDYGNSSLPVVILDHNQANQSPLRGHNMQARLIGIIDHHAIQDNVAAAARITEVEISAVGSTCTIVADYFMAAAEVPSREAAGCLLSGILSDTLGFRSPTTTAVDEEAARWLQPMAGVADLQVYFLEMINAKDAVQNQTAAEKFTSDAKSYDMVWQDQVPCPVYWATLEGVDVDPSPSEMAEFASLMDQYHADKGYSLVYLSFVNVLDEHALLQTRSQLETDIALQIYPGSFINAQGLIDLGSRLSRKLEFIPPLQIYVSEHDAPFVI